MRLTPGVVRCTTCNHQWDMSARDLADEKYGLAFDNGDFTCHVCLRPSEHASDAVNHPKHYNEGFGGAEVIDIARHLNFNRGNVVKYVARAHLKGRELEDLEKAKWYLEDEIARFKKCLALGKK